MEGATFALIYGLAAFVVVRFGFLCLAVAIFVVDLLVNVPLSSHVSEWYFGGPFFSVLSIFALACWAFYIALAGQKLWKESLFE